MHPNSKKLCEVYKTLCAEGQVHFPLQKRHQTNIDSVVKTVESKFFGVTRFPEPEDKVVAYFYLIINDHPFVDGNKRTAVLWFEVFCREHGLAPDLSKYSLDQFAVSTERTDMSMDETIETLKNMLFGQ